MSYNNKLNKKTENFSDGRITSNDLIKTLLFSLLFYIVANNLFYRYLKSLLGASSIIDPVFIQSIVFGLCYLFIISIL